MLAEAVAGAVRTRRSSAAVVREIAMAVTACTSAAGGGCSCAASFATCVAVLLMCSSTASQKACPFPVISRSSRAIQAVTDASRSAIPCRVSASGQVLQLPCRSGCALINHDAQHRGHLYRRQNRRCAAGTFAALDPQCNGGCTTCAWRPRSRSSEVAGMQATHNSPRHPRSHWHTRVPETLVSHTGAGRLKPY